MQRMMIGSLLVFMLALSAPSYAFTIKSGQVVGGDGNVYDGASPEQQEQIVKNAGRTDFFGNQKSSGVVGNNLFIVVEGQTVFVPISELSGKSRETVTNIVRNYIIQTMTADIKAFHGTDDPEALADIAKDTEALANSEYLQETVDKAAEFAEIDAALAADFINATLDLATVDAANEAARAAAEASFEQAFEAANEAAAEAYDAVNGEGAYCEQDPSCEVWTPESEQHLIEAKLHVVMRHITPNAK